MNLTSLAGIKSLLQQYGLHPKKALGQNFLYDRNILHKIVAAAEIEPQDTVVEIGPGLGVLTRELTACAKRVGVIEFDYSLVPLWEEEQRKQANLYGLFQDVLSVDLEAWLRQAMGWQPEEGFKVCANIPYNITTPLLFQLLKDCPNLHSAVLMIQKEVAERMTASPGSKTYGRLSLTVGYYAKVLPVLTVSKHCFYPEPEVDSAVVRIVPYREKPVKAASEADLMDLIQASFRQRRKTILNTMSSFWGLDKSAMSKVLSSLGLDPKARPENLDLTAYAEIVNRLSLPKEMQSARE